MADNEVRIEVVADDKTDLGFDSARQKSRKLGADIDNEVRKVGPKIGQSIGSSISGGIQGAVPAAGQAAAILGVAMAPTLGAAVAAGVIGAAGGLGIAGGLSAAAKDPSVKAAGSSLKAQIGDDLKSAASSFVPVALTSLDKVRSKWQELLPTVRGLFTDSSKLVGPLLDGVLAGATSVIGGIRGAVRDAEPVFEAFGRVFENVGGAVGEMFADLGQYADEGASAVDDLSGSLVHMIETFTLVAGGLAKTKGFFDDLDDTIDKYRYKLEDKTGWDITADGMTTAQRKAAELAEANGELADSQDEAANSTEVHRGALADLSDEMKAQADPAFALLRAQNDLRDAQKEVSKATRDHGKDSEQAREALRKLAEAAIKTQGAAGKLGDTFDGKLTPEMRATLRTAGFTEDQLRDLEGQFVDARKQGDRFAKRYGANVRVEGVAASRRALYGLQDIINDIPRAVNIAARITGVTNVSRQAANIRKNYAHGGITGAASGGMRGEMTMVGEYGPELVDLPPGSQVHSNPDTQRMLGAGGGGGQLEVVITFDPAGASPVMSGILQGLRAEVRAQGGNVQQVVGVAGR
jgi:methyl-accepting chemotaxis protein